MKRSFRYISLLLCVACMLALAAFAVACDEEPAPGETPNPGDNTNKETYTLTFVLPEAVGVASPVISGEAGKTLAVPAAPSYAGHRFDGWYLTADFSGESVTLPATMPRESITYYAKYTKVNTVEFITDGGEEIAPIVAAAGETIVPPATPSRHGYTFLGWYTQPNGAGDKIVALPTVMPEAVHTTYYAHYSENAKLIFDANFAGAEGTMAPAYTDADGKVTIPAAGFTSEGMVIIGWTETPDGKLQFNTEGKVIQGYGKGDTLPLTSDKTLYAQWADDYLDVQGSTDVVYVARDNVESGIGKAILVREGKPDKLGFIEVDLGSGDMEFTFYLDEDEGGETWGKLYGIDRTFRYRDEMYGFYVGYDHITDKSVGEMLYADGYGTAGVFQMVGAQLSITSYGIYLYDENYNEYVFVEIDPATGNIVTDENGENVGFYFTVQKAAIDDVAPPESGDVDAPLNGYFLRISDEAGSYYDYQNGEMGDRMLELNGYGYARLFVSINGTSVMLAAGRYDATGVAGEWLFTPDGEYTDRDGVEAFRFALSYAVSGTQYVYLFIPYDETLDGTFTAADGSTLVMDGYGGMVYTGETGVFEGNFQYTAGATPSITFYAYNEDGDRVATMYFDVDLAGGTFEVNNDEFIVDENGVLTAYRGSSKIVIIPAEVGGRAITAIGDNVFKAVIDDEGNVLFSVEEVIIPATVTSIGSLAFQNNYTLRRVTFLGEVPPTVNFATASDPFRWPAGGFVIVVPEAHKAAYVTAFTQAWEDAGRKTADLYRIKGSVEVTLLPEFEVDADGVLIAYNRPATDNPDELKELILTYGQTEHGGKDIKITAIAPEVFMGATWLRSINLGSVTVIGDAAFEGCTALESVTFDKIATIGAAAFYGCEKLTSTAEGRLNLPAVETIGAGAFAWCTAVKYIVTGENLADVGANAFAFIKIDADLSTPLFFELTGTTPPTMASGMVGTESRSVFAGNSAYRIVIPNIAYAIKCYNESGWSTFCGSLYIPSGDEKGTYVGGSNVLRLDGRAVLDTTYVWLYEIKGESITFYEYVRELGTYVTIVGTIQNNVISFRYADTDFRVTRSGEPMTFVSTDGNYTLVVDDPAKLDPELYMGQKIDATFNGVAVKLLINNYSIKTVVGFAEDGVLYDYTLRLNSDGTFAYTKARTPLNFTAADGSTIRIYGTSHNLVNVKLTTLTYRTATGELVTVENYTSDARLIIDLGGGIYAVPIQRGNDYYTVIMITDGESFTYYTGVSGRTARFFTGDGRRNAIVFYDGETVTGISLLRGITYIETAFEVSGDGYLVTPSSGMPQLVTLNPEDGTCIIESIEHT